MKKSLIEEEKKSFVIYDSFLQATKKMTDHEFREAIWIMRDYALEGKETTTESPLVDIWITMARPNIDSARKRYEQSVINGAKGKNYGWLGGRPAKQDQEPPNNPQKPLNVNEDRNEEEKENVNKNRDEEEDEEVSTYVDDNGVVRTYISSKKAIQEMADAYLADQEYENAHIDDPPAEIDPEEYEQQQREAWEYWERQRRKEEGEDEDYYYDDDEEDDTVPTNSSKW